jgi:hypothetical protein
MPRRLALLAALCATPALADGGLTVPLPDPALLAALSDAQAEDLLEAVVTANVISSNCPDFPITDGEGALLVGTADILAYDMLQLGTEAYDARFYGPAFALLDDPAACASRGPEIAGLLQLLIDMGGSPIPTGPAPT